MVISYRKKSEGFALPTVVIASVVMFAILVAVSSLVSGTRASLDTQYYESLAADAADAGGTMANACIQENNLVSQWSTSTPTRQLQPQTDCTGVDVSGQSRYLLTTPTYRSFFTVDPVSKSSSGVQTATITGTVEVLRKSTGTVQRLYSKRLVIRASGAVSVNKIAFGYVYARGAFFGTVGKDGTMRTVGYNANGQLGNGTNQQTLTPTTFVVPGKSIVAAYTSFLSLGNNMFGVTSDGQVYGAGSNWSGQIGDNSMTDRWTPSRVTFPAGAEPVQNIAVGINSNYFVGNDRKLYAAGYCEYGKLGAGGATDSSSCVRQKTPVAVSLPAGVLATTNVVTDRQNAYVVTTNGALYGWGANEYGQLGNGSGTDSSTPVKFGTFGDSGMDTVSQVQFDGDTVYALTNTGKVYTAGMTVFGQSGNRELQFYNPDLKQCITATSSTTVGMRACSTTANGQRFRINSSSPTISSVKYGTCFDSGTGKAGVVLKLATCTNSASQNMPAWGYNGIPNNALDKQSVTITSASGNLVMGTGSTFHWSNLIPQILTCSAFAADEKVVKISADQWSLAMLTNKGNVFLVGHDDSGQSGSGSTHGGFNVECMKFQGGDYPSGMTATYIYTTNSAPADASALPDPKPAGYDKSWSMENLFVIGSDGKVYGAGSNIYGQLGNGTQSNVPVASPVLMKEINGTTVRAVDVKAGFGTTVVLTEKGAVYAVGNNSNGQLGDGTTTNNSTPRMNRYTNEFNTSYY